MLQPSEEIKSRLDIVDIIRDYIPLKAAGVNFRARCPFHNEKTPSFMISPEKQIWHCFGCGKGGDMLAFVMEIEGVDFAGALRILAPKAGIALTKQDPKLTSEKNRILDILDLSRRYYHKVLLDSRVAANGLAYLQKRGLSDDTIEEWQIGYSPEDWDMTYKFLRSKGYNDKEIFLAGMSVKSQNRASYYDRFRGRIMFPIKDANGATVAFTARVSPEKEATEKMGKYINSPQTLVYDKSKILFGLDKAKQAIKRHDAVIMVEGQMDVITAHQSGWQNVVASSGTALTTEQINLIKRLTSNIYLAFDMDQAGELAADRGIREAMAGEMGIKIIELPESKDPDECIKNNLPAWQKAVADAKPMMQYYFDKTLSKFDVKKVEGKQKIAKILLNQIIKLGSKVEQDYWLKQLANKLDVSENILRETLVASLKKTTKNYDAPSSENKPQIKRISREEKLSELLVAILLRFGSLIEYTQNHIDSQALVGEDNVSLYKNLLFYYNNVINNENEVDSLSKKQTELINYQNFREWLSAQVGQEYFTVAQKPNDLPLVLDKIAILGDEELYDIDFTAAKDQLIKIVLVLKKNFLNQRMKEAAKMIEQAEKEKNNVDTQALMEEFKFLSEELKELNSNFL
ncbi:MAG TPA: DNA primase [bacterium]|nr:DNA primase [bacterium]